ncbi:MAG: hypothetical protein KGN01_07355 [Patescibacteria group bacterium]|nr:hypothetical protein [Patescibacteria group bacterium]
MSKSTYCIFCKTNHSFYTIKYETVDGSVYEGLAEYCAFLDYFAVSFENPPLPVGKAWIKASDVIEVAEINPKSIPVQLQLPFEGSSFA